MKKLILPIIALLSIAALSASAYPPPEKDEVSVVKISAQINSLDGKIVEMEFGYVNSIDQTSSGYKAKCAVWQDRGDVYTSYSEWIEFSGEEALEYFQDLAEKNVSIGSTSLSESVFVLVDGKKLIAVGTKFKKSKGSYSW